jgi:F0F1-type ATP synthase membrane subunit c/vacuolar-type H+-ATPase subunit K
MRPSWQVDLKWAAGLLACLAIVVAGALFSLAHITGRDTAVPLSTAVLSAAISDRVSDEEYAQVQAAAVANPDAPVSLAPTLVTATGREIAGLSKDDAAKLIAGKLATVLYENGDGAAKALIPERRPDSDKDPISLGPTGILSNDNHSMFSKYFLFAAVLSALLLAVVAAMGRGFGRLGGPAFVVALSTAPLAVLWTAAGAAIGEGDPAGNTIVFAARAAARNSADDLKSTFVLVVAVAFAGAIVALLAGIALLVAKRVRARQTQSPATSVVLADTPQSLA